MKKKFSKQNSCKTLRLNGKKLCNPPESEINSSLSPLK